MQIAVIGTGNVGSALGGSLARAGHQVTFASLDPEKAARVSAEVGGSAAATPGAAASGAEVIVLAVPYAAAEALAAELGGTVDGKVVIDATNPIKADFSGLTTEGGPSGGERFAELLPGARVVKAFNTLFASVQADPATHGVTADALFATDDEAARETTAALIRSLGFRPVDVGPLARARQLETLALLNMQMQVQFGGDWRTAFVMVGAPDAATQR